MNLVKNTNNLYVYLLFSLYNNSINKKSYTIIILGEGLSTLKVNHGRSSPNLILWEVLPTSNLC
jgi:hypothetical protein